MNADTVTNYTSMSWNAFWKMSSSSGSRVLTGDLCLMFPLSHYSPVIFWFDFVFSHNRNHFPQHYSTISESMLPAELFPDYTVIMAQKPTHPCKSHKNCSVAIADALQISKLNINSLGTNWNWYLIRLLSMFSSSLWELLRHSCLS